MSSEEEKETADQLLRLAIKGVSLICVTEVGLKITYCVQPRLSRSYARV